MIKFLFLEAHGFKKKFKTNLELPLQNNSELIINVRSESLIPRQLYYQNKYWKREKGKWANSPFKKLIIYL